MSQLNQFSDLIKNGLALHQQGKFDEAKVFYEQILVAQPNHFDALQLLGALSIQTKQFVIAINLLTKALQLNPNHVVCYSNRGIALEELGCLEDALKNYDQVIEIKPDFADAHYKRGNVLKELKRYKEALGSYDDAIKINPDFADAYSNRGIALQELKRFDEALESYDKAIRINPDFAKTYCNRGNTLLELKRFEEALGSYDIAIRIKPDYANAYSNRGNTLQELKRFEEALESYDKAIGIKPDFEDAYYNRGNVLKRLSRSEEAITSYGNALSINPNSNKAQYALATLGVGKTPRIMPRDSVASLFNNYADRFDDHLVATLDYKTPSILFNQFQRHHPFKVNTLLDLGCGTGLSGEVFRNSANNMVGVDISEGMLSKAKNKNIYNNCICEDILLFLESSIEKFNLIICVDVLIYIGDLNNLFLNIRNRLEDKGFFSFSIEYSNSKSYELKTTGRYGHGLPYINDIIELNNLSTLEIQEVNLRKENGLYVPGSAILLQK